MKKTLQLVGAVFLLNFSFAQQGFVVTGLNLQSANGSSTSSIGQVSYSSLQNGDGFTNEGIQQPAELYEFTSLNEQVLSALVSLYPNPATSAFSVQLKNAANHHFSIEIYDAMGNLVVSQNTQTNETVNVQSLAAGIYSVKITTETNHNSIIKLIKN